MKINDIQRAGAVNPYRKANDAKKDYTEGMKPKKKDEVNISSEAKELQGATAVNQQVESLKQAYMTGTYHVEARQIADKLFPHL
jgi:negative regulator of flagellin synthesis FlgM